jgi:hypothetical protein
VPCNIGLVGNKANVVDPAGNFTIAIKDIAGNGIPNTPIVIDFTGCCNDVKVSSTQRGKDGQNNTLTVDVTKKKVLGTTDGNGVMTTAIEGFASQLANTNTPNNTNHPLGCAVIYAGSPLVQMTGGTSGKPTVQVATYDEDGGSGGLGVTGADFSRFLSDWLGGTGYYQRADYDEGVTCSQASGVTGADFSVFLGLWLGGGNSPANDAFTGTCP